MNQQVLPTHFHFDFLWGEELSVKSNFELVVGVDHLEFLKNFLGFVFKRH